MNLNSLYIDYRCSVKPFVNFSLGTILELKSSALPALERRLERGKQSQVLSTSLRMATTKWGSPKENQKNLEQKKSTKKVWTTTPINSEFAIDTSNPSMVQHG